MKVGVLFGGRSGEHEVSLVSATSVINALDKDKYDVVMIGISKEGRWLSSKNTLSMLKENPSVQYINNEKIFLPDPNQKGLVKISDKNLISDEQIDVVFPVLHGTYGEDGSIQGLLELANIPYVGAGVLSSAVGMDKIIQKNLYIQADIPVPDFLWFPFEKFVKNQEDWIEKIEIKLEYPCFIKPANTGSSVGISKAHNEKELIDGIQEAALYDRKILVEKSIEHAKEIEIAVLGGDDPEVSIPGEIIPCNEFYDYDAKYVDGKSEAIIPAKLPESVKSELQEYAKLAFKTIDCYGMARVDFLVRTDDNAIFINEVNTLPGFTTISMYPKLWEASGLSYKELLEKLIDLAIKRHKQKSKLKTSYQPKADWFRG